MAMIRCPQGHFYDPEKNSSCPWCGVPELDLDATRFAGEGKTLRLSGSATPSDEGQTVALVRKKIGIDPVVGWLVCVEGPEKGRDYRIRSEKNAIGRGEEMDIVIKGDETISRSNHAFIIYNPKKRTFRIQAGESRGLVYLNGEEVAVSEELKPYDAIEIGQTRLLFVPFCGEKFEWQ